jgi:HAD superfamily hydrolase (TIGR01549 family)
MVPVPTIECDVNDSLKAIVFDLDGTLYCQRAVRRAMLLRLARSFCFRPARGYYAARLLRSYRQAQELLRAESIAAEQIDIRCLQIQKAAQLSGCDEESIRREVEHWMETKPLDLLQAAMRPGLTDLLAKARHAGLRLGIVSDYPAEAKLQAMEIRRYFQTVVCAQDADVQCFKPNPRGLLVAVRKLGSRPESTLYIGDRFGIDDVAAQRAGTMGALICDSRQALPTTARTFTTFSELSAWLFLGGH